MGGDGEFVGATTAFFVSEIEVRLREAHLTAGNAKSFLSQGLDERPIDTLLNVEALMFEAKALLEVLTIVRRSRAS